MRFNSNAPLLFAALLSLHLMSTATCTKSHDSAFRRIRTTSRSTHSDCRRHGSLSSSSSVFVRGGSAATTTDVSSSRMSLFRNIRSTGYGAVAAIGAYQFGVFFAFLVTPDAAKATYVPALFSYNPLESFFCNSIWTYATDYMLVVVMLYLARKIHSFASAAKAPSSVSTSRDDIVSTTRTVQRLKHRASALMLVYAIQFTGGGLAHQFFKTLESRNTRGFRFLWTVVVGAVCASGAIIGAFASELARLGLCHRQRHLTSRGGRETTPLSVNERLSNIVASVVPSDWFWIGYGSLLLAICAGGLLSYQRPAADTFIAGSTQAPPTFFLMAIVGLIGRSYSWKATAATPRAIANGLSMKDVVLCNLGFVMNSVLLPCYALALYHKVIAVPTLNVACHSWLCGCYSLQGLSLEKIVQIFGDKYAREAAITTN